MSTFSDEPVLISPAKPSPKRLIPVLVVAGFVLMLLGPLAYEAWLDHRAKDVPRGPHHGCTYPVVLDGAPHTIELAYAGPGLAFVISPALAPPEAVTIRVKGSFGDETLAWNPELPAYGPTRATVSYVAHHRLKIEIRAGDRVLWSGKRWAYAEQVDEHEGHTH